VSPIFLKLIIRTYGSDKHFGAVEADAAQHLDGLFEEADVKDRFGELEVSEVSGTLGHVAGARLAPRVSVHDALSRVHQPSELGPSALVRLRVADPALRHRHPTLQKNSSWSPFLFFHHIKNEVKVLQFFFKPSGMRK